METQKDKIFNVGDSVWIASYEVRKEKVTCPVCFGKLQVILIFGNDDQVIFPCDYCAKGYETPRGWVEEYRCEPRCESIKISGREIRETEGMTEVRYNSYDSRTHNSKDIFETKEEALIEAQKRADLKTEEEKTRAIYLKKNINKSYGWNAGYHLREAKRLKEQIAYHEQRAILCKAKDKEEK